MPVVRILSRYTSLKGANMPIANNQHVVKVTEFHKSLKNAGGKLLSKLQVIIQKYLMSILHNDRHKVNS